MHFGHVVVIAQSHLFMTSGENIFGTDKGVNVLTAQIQPKLRFAIESRLLEIKRDRQNIVNGSRRLRFDIIAEILLFCNHQKIKTKIMYSTNLSHVQLKEQLAYLTLFGLLCQDERSYVTTEKGNHFLELYAELQFLLHD